MEDMMDLKDQVLELNTKLVDARHAYYVEASPIISDKEYDVLEQNLKDLVAQDPDLKRYASVLTTIGSDLRDSANRVKHRAPMVSIENKYLVSDVEEWMRSLPAGTPVVIEPKVDGLSLCLRYINRKLVLATTRGDGECGEDVTAQAFASPSIPKTLHDGFPSTLVEIRGEAFMTSGVFDRLNAEAAAVGDKPYANPRNLAAGTLKLKNLKEVTNRDIRFQPWDVFGLVPNPLGASEDLKFLASHSKFGEPRWRDAQIRKVGTPDDVAKAIEEMGKVRETVWSKGLQMQTDGLVFKVDNRDLRNKLGTGNKFNNAACAYKFQSLVGQTVLKDVVWQMGRSGILTPVGILEPIVLGGSMVSRVTLNNISYIRSMGLAIGCEVELVLSGDIIPKITKVIIE
jgi:DNA ligase (NAD+)